MRRQVGFCVRSLASYLSVYDDASAAPETANCSGSVLVLFFIDVVLDLSIEYIVYLRDALFFGGSLSDKRAIG